MIVAPTLIFRRTALLALLAAISIAWFWRFQIAGGFTRAFGDQYDAMIEIALLQHWANVLAGVEAWNVTAYFHPAPDTLGYNDGYLLSGLFYAAGRAMGLSMTGAAEVAHALFKLVGFGGMYLLLRHAGGVRFGWAAFGATLFTVADVTLQHANHGQLFSVALAPWAALAILRAGRALLARERAALLGWGLTFTALFAVWLITSFYLAWFFGLYVMLIAAIGLFVVDRRALLTGIRDCWPSLAVIVVAGAAMLIPFASVYLPKAAETAMHPWSYVRQMLPPLIGLVDVGTVNLAWSPLLTLIRAPITPDMSFGLPPLLLALLIVGSVVALRGRNLLVAVAGLAALIGMLLTVQVGGLSGWWLVREIVPGAAGIRVVGRFAILLLMPTIFVATMMLDSMPRRTTALLLAALLLGEQISVDAPVRLDRAVQARLLAEVTAPPTLCDSFAVIAARPQAYPVMHPAIDRNLAHNVDAMVIAEYWGRPTINGWSTFNPTDWNFAAPLQADYRARVKRYAIEHHLDGMCVLDARRHPMWTKL